MIYKIVARGEWEAAVAAGRYAGAQVDLGDGFIHFSTGSQVAETASKHFRGQPDLVIVAFEEHGFGADLRWEPSRGGDLFPHLYGELAPSMAVWCEPLTLDEAGVPIIPKRVGAC
jgi:uncharacterized protein (DUF952 family)